MKLIIPEPCNQSWDEMQPASDGRFCEACAKNVIDFTGFTDTQLAVYFKSFPRNVCGKLTSKQIDRSLARSGASAIPNTVALKPHSIRRSPLLVGLGFSLLNITSCIPAMGKVSLGEVEITGTRNAIPSSSSENFSTSEERIIKDLKSEDGKLKDDDGDTRNELKSKADCIKTQDTVITGIVKDTAGLPMPGVSVIIDGRATGVITNNEGRFTLKVPEEQSADLIKLSIQHVGYDIKRLSIQAPFSKELNIFLVPVENTLLGEVIIVGGVWAKPTKWQRVKNWVTFWK